jgi:Mor family transcriptional regulator
MNDMDRETPSARRRHKTLQEMAEILGLFLIERFKINATEAAIGGDEVIDLLHQHYGGQNIYIPKDRAYGRLEDDAYIWQHMRRGNASEIAATIGRSYVYVYQRYRAMLSDARRRSQPQLPGLDDETDDQCKDDNAD